MRAYSTTTQQKIARGYLPPMWTLAEAADQLGIGVQQLRRLFQHSRDSGKPQPHLIKKAPLRRYYRSDELKAWVKGQLSV